MGINADHDQIIKGKGYAAAMVIRPGKKGGKRKVAQSFSEKSGIMMEVFSNQPSLQIYNAFFFDGTDFGKQGKPYVFSGGFIFETQGYPDAVNYPDFPTVILEPQRHYKHTSSIQFSLTKSKTK